MSDALIGCTGFVGSTILKQHAFKYKYHSVDINEIEGHNFDLVICAAAPAQKWIANREPNADRQNIEELIRYLKTIKSQTFVLISTVDVFKCPIDVNEDTAVDETELHPYGSNRRLLEKFVESHFSNHLIVRLPGLIGPGLRKNVIYDFLNNNNLNAIESRSVFQFYPMVNLWSDIQFAIKLGLRLVHLTAEPLSVAEISEACFSQVFDQTLANTPANYDLQSKYSSLFCGSNENCQGFYQYSKRETIQAIRAYVQSEPLAVKVEKIQIK